MSRRLIGAVLAAVACFVALSGCRGVLGIDDLDVVSDGGTGSSSGDGSAVTDAPSDGSTGGDTSTTTVVCSASADCPKCCHEALATKAGFPKLVAFAKSTGCICGAGACAQECGSSLCGDTAAEFDAPCGQCVDGAIKKMAPGACDTAKMRCGPDATCKAYLDCMISCR